MALTVSRGAIYDHEGKKLKDICCPLKVTRRDLTHRADGDFECQNCSEVIVNTDHMSEAEIVMLLQQSPQTCLYINLANPIFEVLE